LIVVDQENKRQGIEQQLHCRTHGTS